MKRLFLCATVAVATFAIACSCGKEGDTSQAQVSDISYTECLGNVDKATKANPIWGAPDSVSVSYSDGSIHITHYNLEVNCAFEVNGLAVDIATEGNTITISEHAAEGQMDYCECTTHNTFQINNIPHGTYTLVFTNWYPQPYSHTYTF